MQAAMNTVRTQQGVTLIELMITIAVLAVLASIAIPAYQGYIVTGKKSECFNEIAAIQLAQEEFFLENNQYYAGSLTYSLNTLVTASGGLYRNNTTAAQRNCSYVVATTGGAANSGYTLTVTGTNELATEGTLKSVTK